MYNAERHQIIVQAIRNGNYRGTAAKLAGISPETLKDWVAKGVHQPENYPHMQELVDDIERAEAEVEAELVGVVRQHALSDTPNSWTAAMTYLERKHPDRFGKRDTTVIEGGQTPIRQVVGTVLIDERARDDARSLLRRVAGPGGELTERSGLRDEPKALPPGDTGE